MEFVHVPHELEPSLHGLAPKLLPWIHEASRPFADWYFGDAESAAALIERFMLRPSSELHIGRAMLMLDGELQPIGCVIGLPGNELASCRAADFTAFCDALASHPDRDEIAAETIAVSHELFPAVAPDEFYLSRIVVDPAWRRRGLGRALVQRAIEAQRTRGFTRFRLDVSADNVAAIRTYESLGMCIARRARSEEADLEYCMMSLSV
jgi:ribosomal protein S18 acetylase RimI-like enzyme